MIALDPVTMLWVDALFVGVAVLGWLLLGLMLRVAPQASLHMACAHALLLVALLPQPAPQLNRAWLLLALSLLALSLRRLLRLRVPRADLPLLLGLGLTASFAALLGLLPHLLDGLAGLCMTLLAFLTARDVMLGTLGVRRGLRVLLLSPYLLLSGGLLLQCCAIGLWGPDAPSPRSSGTLAALWLLESMMLSTSTAALVLRRLLTRIEQLSRCDALTGLYNRRGLDEQLQVQQALQQRGQCYSVVLMDLDHFKRINDQLGHAAGDAALQFIAGLLRAQMRGGDVVARIGGEEFALLLPGAGEDTARLVAERLRRQLAGSDWRWHGRRQPLSASFGLTQSRTGGETGADCIERADQALLRAKREGRDRVCVSPREETAS